MKLVDSNVTFKFGHNPQFRCGSVSIGIKLNSVESNHAFNVHLSLFKTVDAAAEVLQIEVS